jgi:[acyl-carrier-protein] S-malonyltransferase
MHLACMFPGQGSQSLGMLKSIADTDNTIAAYFSTAKNILGIDYWDMIQNGQEEQINQTMNTQVIMLIADVAMYHFLLSKGMPSPQWMAGHSLGEYSALVCANAIEFTDALKLVFKRAELMQQAVSNCEGAMAAIIGLDNHVVENICEILSKQYSNMVLEPANFNAPGQIVVAGHFQLVKESLTHFEASGAKLAKIIPVSVPCHCSLMLPAAEYFKEFVEQTSIKIPEIKLFSNVDVSIYESVEQIKNLLVQQLYKSVRWTDILQAFKQHSVTHLMECGPGKVLCGLAKRTVPELKTQFCYEINHLPEWDVV